MGRTGKGMSALHGPPCGLCHWCGLVPATTWDHIVPVSRHGSNAKVNMAPSCWPCNNLKASELAACDCMRCAAAYVRWIDDGPSVQVMQHRQRVVMYKRFWVPPVPRAPLADRLSGWK